MYPGSEKPDDPITHFFHAHQESVVSAVVFLQAPSPVSPMTFGDPRGALREGALGKWPFQRRNRHDGGSDTDR